MNLTLPLPLPLTLSTGHDRVVDEARGARQAIGRPHFPELVHLGVLARHEDQREDEDLVVRGRAGG